MITKLTTQQIQYVINQCKNGKSTTTISSKVDITQRHVQRLLAEFRTTGTIHILKSLGRKKTEPLESQVDAVLQEHQNAKPSALHTTRLLHKKGIQISYNTTYRIMKENGLVESSAAKSKRRKWVAL